LAELRGVGLDELQLFDVTGRLIMKKTVTEDDRNAVVPMGAMPSGVYFIVGKSDSHSISTGFLYLK
jgi:hypothetical protein